VHVAHVIVDAWIDGDLVNTRMPAIKPEHGPEGMLSPDAIADAYWTLHKQHRVRGRSSWICARSRTV